MEEKKIVILLATYNGERYLRQQLDSLMRQTYKNWELYIQDDSSTDTTVEIIKEYQRLYSNIVFLQPSCKLGAKGNFIKMLEQVEADYYFFCDQDDVWLEDKVESSLQYMSQLEKMTEYADKPIVVHTDLKVVDSELNTIAPSFWAYSHVNPVKLSVFSKLATRNVVTGCTMLFNKSAREQSLPVPEEACMHDLWVTLSVMKVGGVLKYIESPKVLYRQHRGNVVGIRNAGGLNLIGKKLFHLKSLWNTNVANYRMLRCLNYGSWMKYIYYKIITLCESRL